ncbi:MAG: hypothetical protein DME56_12175 [Verrucomicrobia bacterium]|nr:MAG: hypothetical protein DME56_12175 [Verrucomicrobiota bacterium]
MWADEKLATFSDSNRRFARTILSFVEYQKRSRLSFSGFEGADELSINAIPQTLVICVVAYFQAGDWIDSLVS